jgi:hypothetical protein
MRWRLWITITLFLFLSAFLALGDRYVFAPPKYVFAPPKTTIASDEPPFGFFQILAPGDQLGKYCGGPSEKTWLKEYYCNIKATDRYLVIFTLWLALATIVLAVSTIGLWIVSVGAGNRQSRETQILQRAYISVEPGGIRPYQGEGENRIACDVVIVNAGNLPARNIKWLIKRKYSYSAIDADFKVDPDKLDGDIVLAPKAHARKGAPATSRQELNEKQRGAEPDKAWLYIWGRVSYHDGFRADRWIEFCHRYNLRGGGHVIDAENGRYHEKGNRTDEG